MPTITTDRRILFPALAMALLCVGLIAGVMLYHGDSSGSVGGPFSLVASDGRIVTDRSFRGKYMLVYFGYTFCPDVCPTTMADLAIALKALGTKADGIQPLFITVDPARDTPAVLKSYVAQFWPTLLGLTGTSEQIASVEKDYKVYSEVHRTGTGSNDYEVDHSSVFYLMDRDGKFVTVIAAEQQGDAIAADIGRHLP